MTLEEEITRCHYPVGLVNISLESFIIRMMDWPENFVVHYDEIIAKRIAEGLISPSAYIRYRAKQILVTSTIPTI